MIIFSTHLLAADVPFQLPPFDIARGSVSGVTSVKIGDIDKDGLPDVAVFEGGAHAAGGQTFAWFEAPGWVRHNFNPSYSPGPFLGDSELVDINGDGYLDVVLPEDPHSGNGTGSLYWYENPKNGSTAPWPRQLIGSWNNAIHIGDIDTADMDNDGKMDVVIRHLGSNTVRICFQNSPPSWTTRAFSVRLREGLMLADLDRDGMTDILLNGFWWAAPANPRTQGYTEYLIDNVFYTQPASGLNNSTKGDVGDVDGDGIDDVVLVPAEGQYAYLAWYKCPQNPRSQSWVKHVIESNWGNMHQAELGDFDGDGDLDIAGGLSFGATGVFLWQNNGSGQSWTRQTLTTNQGLYYGVIGDFGADGDLDIVGPTTYSNNSRPLLYENLSSAGAPLAAPGNLSATPLSESAIRLTWNDSNSNESGFKIERRAGAGSFAEIAQVSSATMTFDDTSLPENSAFTYRVRAWRPGDTSPPSNEDGAVTPSDTAPPRIDRIDALSPVTLRVTFNETVELTSAENLSNYAITNPFVVPVIGATRNGDAKSVTLTVGPLIEEVAYTLSVTGVRDTSAAGNSMIGASAAFAWSEWINGDIGAVAAAGNTTREGGTFTVAGSGADIWGTADAFQFVYKEVEGDGEIVARVASRTGGDDWAKAGIMIRETLAPDSRHALMQVSQSHGTILDFRAATGGNTAKISGADAVTPPCWLKLTREGSVLRGFVSIDDGITWREIGSATVPMPGAAYWGLAVTSHVDGILSTAVFDNVSIVNYGAAPAAPTGLKRLLAPF